MTLIFSWLTDEYVLQIADRLLTSKDPITATIDQRDPVANKSVIFRAKNALVAIGYSGHAYLEGIPTDQWIVEKITGEKTFEFAPGQPASMFGRIARWLDVGDAMLTLDRELNRAFPRTQPAIHEVTMTGWQWRRDPTRARPVIGRITNRPAGTISPDFTSGWIERRWHLERHPSDSRIRRVLLDSIGWSMSSRERNELEQRLGNVWHSATECQRILADTIRGCAARPNSTVGPNCMSVFLPHPRYGRAEANFLPAQEHRAAVSGGGRLREEV